MASVMTTEHLGTLGIRVRDAKGVFARVMIVYPQGWLAAYLQKHWTKAGARKYGYTPRAGEPGSGRAFRGSYTHRKLVQQNHTRPLEFTGTGRAMATGGKRAAATRRTARAVLPAPVFNYQNPQTQIDMRAELTTVAIDEQSQLEALANDKVSAEYSRLARRHR